MAADHLDRVAGRLEDEIDGDLAIGDANGAVGQCHPATAQHRALPEAPALAIPHRPEGLRDPGDVDRARAQHQLGAVHADVAPALQRPGPDAPGHRSGRQREPRGAIAPIAPVGQRVEHAGYALRD